ncbi:MAG: hypothetical protein JXA30_12910 [Deltaproteobacteria bacterium]|nr:hypothetical protein [Deltaproteobacteria bacterium]
MSRTTILLVTFISFLLTGIGLAQVGEQEEIEQSKPEENVRPATNLPVEVQIEEGQAVVAYGKNLNERISNMLSEARKESDIIRITCLNDKLTQTNANLRNAQQRLKALTDAVDRETRNHEYTVLMVLKQKFKTLDQEAGQCVGQDIYEIGQTQVTTEIDDSVAAFDESPTMTPDFGPSFIEVNFPTPATTSE